MSDDEFFPLPSPVPIMSLLSPFSPLGCCAVFSLEQLQEQYAPPPSTRSPPARSVTPQQSPLPLLPPSWTPPLEPRVPPETWEEALDGVWRAASGGGARANMGWYGPARGAKEGGKEGEVTWGRLCVAIGRYFERKVPGARERPLESRDFDLFASDAALWRRKDGSLVSQAERKGFASVSEMSVSRERLETFWLWFWQAVTTLCSTSAWSTGGLRGRAPGFAGFMRKDEALARLSGKEPGTFLIRFSMSERGALAVHYTSTSRGRRRGELVGVIVQVSSAGELSIRDGKRPYHDLDDLVLSLEQLRFLHPDVRKDDVFSRPERRGSWATGEGWAGVEGAAGGYLGRRRQSVPPM